MLARAMTQLLAMTKATLFTEEWVTTSSMAQVAWIRLMVALAMIPLQAVLTQTPYWVGKVTMR